LALALNHKLDRAGQVLEVALSNAHKHLGSNADLIGEIEANLRAVRGRVVFDTDKEAGSASPVGPLRLDAETAIDDTPRIDGLPPLPQADQEKRPPDREVSALIEAADQRYPRRIARPLIELAALLGPGEVPVAVLTSKPCIDHCTRRAGDAVSWQAKDLIDALYELQQAGLIVLDETPSVFRIPDDLRRAVRHVTDDYHQSAAAAAAIMVARAEVPDSHAWALCEAAVWLYHESGSALVEAGVHPLLFHVGRDLTSFGALRAAVAFFNRLLADCLRMLGRDHVDTLTVRWHLVDAQRLGGDEGGAVGAYQRLIRAETNALGAHHDVTLGTRSDLGNLYVRLKHYDAAVDTFDRMCADIEALDGRRSFRMFVLRQAAATCRWLRGDYAEAAALLESLLADQLYSIGPADDFTLTTRGLLARCRGDAGDPSGAVAAINELISALRQRLPVDDEEIQQCRLARAHWLSVAERFGEAVEAYRRSCRSYGAPVRWTVRRLPTPGCD
jgi:tetratricopeptide (TPR) repeat protein